MNMLHPEAEVTQQKHDDRLDKPILGQSCDADENSKIRFYTIIDGIN